MDRFLVSARAWCFAVFGALAVMGSTPSGARAQDEDRADAPAEAEDDAKAGGLDEEATQLNLESFDFVWETIRDKHFDPELNGADWPAIREELRPKVAEAESMAEAREAISAMIERLHQSHFGIIPSSVYEALDAPDADRRGDGTTGLHVRVVEGKALVVKVEGGSPAEAQGVAPGWIIEAVQGEPVAPAIEKIDEAYGDSTLYDLYASRSVERQLGGPVGAERSATFRDGDDEPSEVTMSLARPTGTVARFGNLPPMRVSFESRTLDGAIPYVSWSSFFDPSALMPKIGAAITDHPDAPGLVIDLRGNPGGIGAMAMGISGWLIEQSGSKLGTMTTRDTALNFVVLPRPTTYPGPVAVIVDGCSASTSEIFAGGLQDLGRARVFGTATAGAALPSTITKLPNGDGFQYAFANYVSADGEALEGSGVVPDEATPPTRSALLQGLDPALDAAVAWIKAESAARSSD